MTTKVTTSKSTSKTAVSAGRQVTMADLLAKSKSKVKDLFLGQKIPAVVTQKLGKSLILDIGGKSEGVVTEKAFSEAREYISKLKVGDSVVATVLVPEMRDGTTLLSLRDSVQSSNWKFVEDAHKNNSEVPVLAKSFTNSGITVDVNGISGFIPTSQLSKEFSKDPSSLVGKAFKAKVVELDRSKNKLVLSEREVTDAKDIELGKIALESVKDGDVFEGQVTTVANFGIFVKISVGKQTLEGLVHISELSWGKITHPSENFKVGDKVKVMAINRKDSKDGKNKLALSIKQASKDPWINVDQKYKKDDKISGRVSKVTDFGTFIVLEEGVEGLIHITKIAPGKKFSVGDEVNCYIEEIDSKSRKISLGLVLTSIPVGYK